ncbi:hypothetical protein [Thalassospira xiamenensis]|uniref:hypothetical protein n=1 Tax=Thalassospira xiamenensis TaxID=220697 RepID=UPI003AA893B4
MAKRAKRIDVDARSTRPTNERRGHGTVTLTVIPAAQGVNQMVWRSGGRDWLQAQFNRGNITKDQFSAALEFETAHSAYHATDSVRSGIDPEVLAMKAIGGASTKGSTGMNDRQLEARKAYGLMKSAMLAEYGQMGLLFLVSVIIDGWQPKDWIARLDGRKNATSDDGKDGIRQLRRYLEHLVRVG